jgi:formylglycine-generating enzyme required for sulfatase activity
MPQHAVTADHTIRPRSCALAILLLPLTGVATFAADRPVAPLAPAEERALKPGDRFKECDACPEMVVLPAGSFTMGSPESEPGRSLGETQLKVTIARPFAAGKLAVTFDEWDACVADGGCAAYRPTDGNWGRGTRPVINVKWDDVSAYMVWLSRKTGRSYRLLSETEREYAARAGTSTAFWWGPSITTAQANYHGGYSFAGGAKGEVRGRTVPADSFGANPWGLYNVHGNIWEWTEDCWNETNAGNPRNGRARKSGDCSSRVLRGGGWMNNPAHLRSAHRYYDSILNRNIDVGFRVGRSLAR